MCFLCRRSGIGITEIRSLISLYCGINSKESICSFKENGSPSFCYERVVCAWSHLMRGMRRAEHAEEERESQSRQSLTYVDLLRREWMGEAERTLRISCEKAL